MPGVHSKDKWRHDISTKQQMRDTVEVHCRTIAMQKPLAYIATVLRKICSCMKRSWYSPWISGDVAEETQGSCPSVGLRRPGGFRDLCVLQLKAWVKSVSLSNHFQISC